MADTIKIIIEAVGNADAVINKTTSRFESLKSTLLTIGAVAGTTAIAYKKLFDVVGGSVKAYQDYAREVERFSQAAGVSADESARVIQVTDDLKVSYEALERAVKANADTMDFSVEGLAAASDEYLMLTDSAEKAKFMQERFGRSWVDFVKLMETGGDEIRSMAGEMSGALIMTQRFVDQSNALYRAQDQANDAMQGAKVAMGQYFAPAMEVGYISTAKLVDKVAEFFLVQAENRQISIETSRILKEQGLVTGNLVIATQEQIDVARAQAMANIEAGNAAFQAAEGFDAEAEAIKAASDANLEMLGVIQNVQSETERYSQTSGELAVKLADLIVEQDKYVEGSSKYGEIGAAIDEVNAKIAENEQAHRDATNSIIFNLLQQQLAVEGLNNAEMAFLLNAGVQMGLLDQATVTLANDLVAQAGAMQESFEVTQSAGVESVGAVTGAFEDLKAMAQDAKSEVMNVGNAVLKIDGYTATVVINIQVNGELPSFRGIGSMMVGGQSPYASSYGPAYRPHYGFAEGGSFVVPSRYGNEGFNLGGMATASAGETVTVSKNGEDSTAMLSRVMASMPTERGIGREVARALAQQG